MRLIFKILKYFLLAAAAIAAAALIFVESAYFKGLLKNALAAQLRPLTGGSLTVDKLRGNAFTGVELEGVRLAGAGGTFFYAERIDAAYSLPALVSGRIYLTRVTIYRPSLTIEQNASGRWSYEGLFPSSNPPKADRAPGSAVSSVVLGEVRINEGRITLKYLYKPATLDINGVYLSGSARISGDAADIVINSLSAKGTRPLLAIKTLSGTARVKGSDLSIKGFRIDTEHSSVLIDGTITGLGNPAFNLNVNCPAVSLEDIGGLVPGIRPAGTCSSVIKVTGVLEKLKIIQSLEYNSLKVNNEVVVRFGIPSISVTSRIRSLRPCDIIPVFAGYERKACPRGEISMDIMAEARGNNLDELSSIVSVLVHPSSFAGFDVGESSFTASIGGRNASLEGGIELSSEYFFVSVLGKAGKNAFRLDKLKVKSPRFGFASKGSLGYAGNDQLDLAFNLDSADLGVLSVFLPGMKIGGVVSSTGALRGTLDHPALSADIEGRYLSFQGFGADSLDAKIALTGFKLPPEGTADVRVTGFRSGGTALEKINVHARNSGNSGFIEVSADKNSSVTLRADAGFSEKSRGAYSIDINKFNVSAGTSAWSNDGDIKVEASKDQLRVDELRISNGDQRISAKGVIGRAQNINMKFDVESADIRYLNDLAGLELPVSGALSADIGVKGSYLSPLISGTINIRNAAAGGLAFDRVPLTLKYAEKKLEFEARLEYKDKTLFIAAGSLPVDLSLEPVKDRFPREGLRVSIKSSGLGLDILPVLTEQVKSASGQIRTDILIEGNPLSPVLHGSIDISGGSLTLLATQTEYSGINAGIELDGSDVLVRRLTMKSGDGSAEVTGKILLKGFTPVDAELALKCRNFTVMRTNLFTGSIDSDIRTKGLSASGKVTVTQGVVNIPSQSRTAINEIEYVQTGPGGLNVLVPAPATPDIYKQLILDIRVSIPEKTWVNGQGVRTEIRGDLDVTKEKDSPMSYDGEINVIRGTYKINERTLIISEGKLIPRGTDIMNSLISAKASCKLTDISIDVMLGGTLNKPIINFQSDPPMERNDIISSLAFGAPSSKLSMSQSSAIHGTSFDILAGFAEKDIKGVVSRVVPIDELTLHPSEGSWAVGKNITDKLSAKYEWRSGQDESPQTVLDYRLDKHFSLDSLLGDPLTSGVDLFWKFGY